MVVNTEKKNYKKQKHSGFFFLGKENDNEMCEIVESPINLSEKML